jgi:hypothetical protein
MHTHMEMDRHAHIHTKTHREKDRHAHTHTDVHAHRDRHKDVHACAHTQIHTNLITTVGNPAASLIYY